VALGDLAFAEEGERNYENALEAAHEAQDVLDKLGLEESLQLRNWLNATLVEGRCLAAMGQLEEAEIVLVDAYEAGVAVFDQSLPCMQGLMNALIHLYQQLEDFERAREYRTALSGQPEVSDS